MIRFYSLKFTGRPIQYLVTLLLSFGCLSATHVAAQIALPYTEDFSGISAADGFPSPTGGSWARTGTTTLQPTYITNQSTYNRIGHGDTKFMSFRYGQGTPGNAYTVGPFSLTASTTYQVSLWYIADGATGFGPLSLTYGTGTTLASQSNTITSVAADITNTTYTQMAGTFTPATSGSYYIGIVCAATSNPWYLSIDDFSVSVVPPCTGTPTPGIATTFSPLAVTGFNADVIANGVGAANVTTTSDVDGGGYYFLDSTYLYTATSTVPPTYALPANGIINSAATPGLVFNLQSASSNNSLRIAATNGSGTLTLTTPVSATNLYLLATSGSGAATVDVTVTFTTAATQTFTGLGIADWFGGTPIAIAPVGRVTATNTQDGTSTNPRLYQLSLPISSANASLNIASITVTRTSTAGFVQVMAVSATTKTPAAVCAGSGTKTLTMANPPTTAGNTYQWQESSVLGGPYTNVTTGTGGTTLAYTTPTLTATKYYVLKITCASSTLSALTNEVAIVVNPQPTLSVTSLPASANICGTGSVSLTASGNGTSYTWFPATGLSASNIANPVATPAATTTYTVTAKNSSGCTSTATKTVSVYSLTTITATANPSTLCAGGNTTLTAVDTSFGSTTAPTGYTNGTVVNPTTDEDFGTITFGSLSNTTTCGSLVGTIGTATGTAGSYSNFTAAAPVKFIAGNAYSLSLSSITCGTVNYSNSIAVYIDYNQNGSFLDAGETVYIATSTTSGPHTETATPTIPATAKPGVTRMRVIVNEGLVSGPQMSPSYGEIEDYSIWIIKPATIAAVTGYTWSPGTFLASATGSPAAVTGITSSTTYTVTGVDANGCSATGTVAVTVNPLPTLSVAPAVASICGVGSVVLTASGSAVSYSWSPATGLSATTGATVTANPTTTTTYTITATGANGCVNTATRTVTVNPLPTIAISPATPTISCAGSNISLTASGAATYSWSPAAGLSAATGATVTASPTTTTTYIVTGTDANGCTNTASKLITVNPLPAVTITPSGSTAFCGSGSVMLTAGGTASIYSWGPATGLSAITGTTVTATPTVTTAYTLTGTDGNGCINTATQLITVNPIPTVTISPSTATTICSGTGVALTAGGSGTYSWSPSSSLSSATGTTVTASPTVTTTYTVTGTDVSGCTNTATKTITVNPSPSLTISPAAATAFCIGGSVVLTASGATSSYSWTPATGLSATTGATVTATPTATTTYTVSSTAANGCTGTATKLITVNPLPTVTISPATAASVCLGSGVLLTAGGAATYSWTPAAGLSAVTGTAVTATPTATITYTITGTDVNGCVNTATKLVTVNGVPTVAVSPATTSTICTGFSVALTASGAVTYSWSPSSSLSSGTGAAVTASPTATTTYIVTGTGANGCSSTATKTINVNPLPPVSISPAVAAVICSGSGIVLTASGASTYAWTPAAGLSAATGATVTASPAASTNYIVTGTDANGCVNTASKFVTVNGLPTITVSPFTPSTICEGLSVILTANGASTYSWSPSSGLSAATGSVVTASPTVTTTYTVTGTNTNGCINTATKTVTVTPKPVSDITPAGYITLCQYDSITLVAAPGYATYTWMIYGTPIPFATTSNLTTVTGGFYTLKITDAGGCTSTTDVPTVITIDQLPIPLITAKSNVLDAGAGYASYLWYLNGSAITGATGQTYTPSQNGTYTVAVTKNNSTCTGKSLPFDFVYVGIGSIVPVSNAIRLYPNPASDVLNIDAPMPVSITVSSMVGKQILFNEDARRINISEWADGVYRVVIRDKSGAYLKMEKITKLAK